MLARLSPQSLALAAMSLFKTPDDLLKDRLYFAYGSNLHVSQMAKRCPESTFVGKATLQGYRWQINQRGVANIVESDNIHVEGLLYSISKMDEKSLDRSESVSAGFYEKRKLFLDFDSVRNDSLYHFKTGYVAKVLKREDQKTEELTSSKAIEQDQKTSQSKDSTQLKNSALAEEYLDKNKGPTQPPKPEQQTGSSNGHNEATTTEDPSQSLYRNELKQDKSVSS